MAITVNRILTIPNRTFTKHIEETILKAVQSAYPNIQIDWVEHRELKPDSVKNLRRFHISRAFNYRDK